MTESWISQRAAELAASRRTDVLIANDRRCDTLMETLALAVPWRIWELQDRTPEQRVAIARRCKQEVASHGDTLMFGGKKGEAARVFNALAEGLAVAAYQPGGVTFAGQHWCTDHEACERAAAGLPDKPSQIPPPRSIELASPAGEWADAL